MVNSLQNIGKYSFRSVNKQLLYVVKFCVTGLYLKLSYLLMTSECIKLEQLSCNKTNFRYFSSVLFLRSPFIKIYANGKFFCESPKIKSIVNFIYKTNLLNIQFTYRHINQCQIIFMSICTTKIYESMAAQTHKYLSHVSCFDVYQIQSLRYT